MNKKSFTEADIRTKFITPAIEAAGWDKVTQMREEYFFTAGRIIVRGKLVARGKPTSMATSDPEGEPEEILVEPPGPPGTERPGPEPRRKIRIDGVAVTILLERVEYMDEHGKLVTESLRDYYSAA